MERLHFHSYGRGKNRHTPKGLGVKPGTSQLSLKSPAVSHANGLQLYQSRFFPLKL